MTLTERDNHSIWHPFTQHQQARLPFAIKRGEGAYLFDEQNKRYLDCISSWWVTLHGHAHPDIASAIYQQAMTLEQVIFSGFTHEPAVSLAEELLHLLPSGFSKVFYSDNGSTAVEVALKMAYQYWRNLGESQRCRFVAFEQGYHGDTFGAMSVGKKSGFFSHFENLLFDVKTFAYPATWLNDEAILQKELSVLEKIVDYLDQYHHEIAALIIEPLIQGAAGMRMCRAEFLQQLENLMRQYGILIIYDEVMTGFGRTGELFACHKAKTHPDIICLSKGLTGGFLPLSVTACHQKIYQAFLGENFTSALAHGHSFTANPLGCAAALASLKLLKQAETRNKIKTIETIHSEMLKSLLSEAGLAKLRYCGTIAAFDLGFSLEYGDSFSLILRENFMKKGLLIRPLGNVLYLLPPFCITENELRHIYDVIALELRGITA